MSLLDEEGEELAHFLESEILSEVSDQEDKCTDDQQQAKRPRADDDKLEKGFETAYAGRGASSSKASDDNSSDKLLKIGGRRIESGILSKIPPELFRHVLKFLPSEDLVSCSQVCKFMNYVASDESLWRRLYCQRWGLLPTAEKLRVCAWKTLYIRRDEKDMIQSLENCPLEFKEYYIQMHAAKRSQVPIPSQVSDDLAVVDKTIADQIDIWKSSKGLKDKEAVLNHLCSGETCSYHQIGNVFVCEKTGNVHLCDETCKEVIQDSADGLLVCRVSGRCFDRLCELDPDTPDTPDTEQHPDGAVDEAEPCMGRGRLARAYLLGYNCDDEKELEDCLRFC